MSGTARDKLITVEEFMKSYKLCRASTYKLINSGKLKSVKVLDSRFIVIASAEALFSPKDFRS